MNGFSYVENGINGQKTLKDCEQNRIHSYQLRWIVFDVFLVNCIYWNIRQIEIYKHEKVEFKWVSNTSLLFRLNEDWTTCSIDIRRVAARL